MGDKVGASSSAFDGQSPAYRERRSVRQGRVGREQSRRGRPGAILEKVIRRKDVRSRLGRARRPGWDHSAGTGDEPETARAI